MLKVPKPFISMPLALAGMRGLPAGDKILWAFLRWREKDDWTRLPERTYLANKTGMSRHSVQNALRRLMQAGLIARRTTGDVRFAPVFFRTALPAACASEPSPVSDQPGRSIAPDCATTPDAASSASALALQARPRAAATWRGNEHLVEKNWTPRWRKSGHKEENSKDSNSRENGPAANGPTYGGLSLSNIDGLRKEEKSLLAHTFPHGCTQAQMQALLQAATAAARTGVPYSFMASAQDWPCDETAPWKKIELHAKALRKDVAEVAYWTGATMGDLAGYRKYMDANQRNQALRDLVDSKPALKRRVNACFVWPAAARPQVAAAAT
jgi:hypothetical protein